MKSHTGYNVVECNCFIFDFCFGLFVNFVVYFVYICLPAV